MREERSERIPAPARLRHPLVRKRERAIQASDLHTNKHANASAREEAFARAVREMSEMADRFNTEET